MHVGPGYAVHNDQQAMDLAWASYDMKMFDIARNGVQAALNINPANIDAYNLLGLIELKVGSVEKSIVYLEKGKELIRKNHLPNGDFIFCKLGIAYYKNDEFSKALQAFMDAKNINDAYGTEFQIAITQWRMGEKTESLNSLNRSMKFGNSKNEAIEFLNEYSINMDDLKGLLNE